MSVDEFWGGILIHNPGGSKPGTLGHGLWGWIDGLLAIIKYPLQLTSRLGSDGLYHYETVWVDVPTQYRVPDNWDPPYKSSFDPETMFLGPGNVVTPKFIPAPLPKVILNEADYNQMVTWAKMGGWLRVGTAGEGGVPRWQAGRDNPDTYAEYLAFMNPVTKPAPLPGDAANALDAAVINRALSLGMVWPA